MGWSGRIAAGGACLTSSALPTASTASPFWPGTVAKPARRLGVSEVLPKAGLSFQELVETCETIMAGNHPAAHKIGPAAPGKHLPHN